MGWPRAVAFVLPNELFERFGLFGMLALMNQYLKTAFGLKEGEAKTYVHLFNALICTFPVVGGAISDSYLGKYYTVVIFSLISLVGNVMLSIFSVDGVVGELGRLPIWAFLVPVCLIAIGSGGAKPCAISHAGDQFTETKLLDRFYSIHSMMMSIGILLAVIVIPLAKEEMGYHLAYGICTLALLVSLVTFISGKRVFTIVPPNGEFLPWQIAKLTVHATVRKAMGHKAENWLDLVSDSYDAELIQEARQFLRVAVIFAPLIFMWMLNEQNATEWQNQYEMMDKVILGITIPTESSSLASALMIVFLLPFMGFVFFPFLERRGIQFGAGARVGMGYGLFLASFFVSTILQYPVQAAASNRVIVNNVVVSCEGCVSGAWQLPQWILSSLGDTILGPSLGMLAYSNVGPKLKASAISLILLTIALANCIIILMEPVLSHLESPINRQWCYVSISSVFFVVYFVLLKTWFVPPASKVHVSFKTSV
ncbi:hypothetical protein DSO57_1001000 [Entomophthora muscae]|uniref:Uncharacterized protein n=1 Tax=Entomophthora muscae TaxID=34485 RepID=A0ACC2UJS4_9FUNG|nr:hypothetical protein DSO57_1001000 [Entomophthora muscae]